MAGEIEVIDPTKPVTEISTLDKVQAIVPYFPDNEKMSRYIIYISSGWTRQEAKIRANISRSEYEDFLKDDRFREIDQMPYNELRESLANAYAEMKVRRLAMSWIEFDEEFMMEMQRKIATGQELTKDERAIFLKRASMYGPDTFNTANKLLNPQLSVEDIDSGSWDIAAFVLARKSG